MTRHCSLIVMASATLFLTAAFIPAQAQDASDAVGGAGNAVGNAVGGVTGPNSGTANSAAGSATGAANGVTGDNAQTTASVGSNGELSADSRSAMADGIEAQARAFSPQRLARLCASAGGGSGCGSGDRTQVLGIIDNRLDVIGDERLASLCVSSGADGCGSGAASANPIADGSLTSIVANLSESEVVAYKKRCRSVLGNPQAFDDDLVELCKLIK